MVRRLSKSDKTLVKRIDDARAFPANTCPASRHAQMIGEHLIRSKRYAMLAEEPEHCGESILATVAALYEARTEVAKLRAMLLEEVT